MRRLDMICLALRKEQQIKSPNYHRLLRTQARDSVVFYVEAQMIGCPVRRANCRLVTKCKASLIGLSIRQVRVAKTLGRCQKLSGLKLR